MEEAWNGDRIFDLWAMWWEWGGACGIFIMSKEMGNTRVVRRLYLNQEKIVAESAMKA